MRCCAPLARGCALVRRSGQSGRAGAAAFGARLCRPADRPHRAGTLRSHRSAAGGDTGRPADFILFAREATPFPWQSQALWIYSQLVRWRMVEASEDAQARAAAVFRPDVYRRALAASDSPMPGASMKVEGALDAPLAIAGAKALSPWGRTVSSTGARSIPTGSRSIWPTSEACKFVPCNMKRNARYYWGHATRRDPLDSALHR